ncbi:sulfite exporter TauE/SafE family protein [Sinorhizobium sp. BG8]|uniref:sulfite exporter TauE/SafE family protein n=1 Tax=Sinorhizobium sp. BG8 TaxID=2613773 RepID=UPI00193EA19C|nr:sulfite exporter TauE/SafE family protein [Sinorhizobium sp. BG8]QRM53528.1 sulfite exporter TauE/SafE family protein [Sinorhizobium sp. BG8]
MSIADILLLFAAGFLSGTVNAIAGGGTFLTFGAMTVTGLPPIVANATSSITQFPGYVTSALAYSREIRADWREALLLGGLSLVGGLAGALILLSLSNPSFRAMVPWLLLAATAIFAAGPLLRPRATFIDKPVGLFGLVGQFATSIYGGFFGAGMGIMMLAVLGLSKGGDYHRLNALKNFLAMVIAAVAIVVFASGNVVGWPQAAVMIPGGALGGYSGVWAARRVPQPVIRALVVMVGLALTVYYFVTG